MWVIVFIILVGVVYMLFFSSPKESTNSVKSMFDTRPEVAGPVMMDSGKAEATCGSCDNVSSHATPIVPPKTEPKDGKDAKTTASPPSTSKCKTALNNCDLVYMNDGGVLGCSSPGSLCDKHIAPVYRVNGHNICTLKEYCGWGFGGWGSRNTNYISSITVPKGMQMDLYDHQDSCGKREKPWKTIVCDDKAKPKDCVYSQNNWHRDLGFKFSVLPGYKLTCGTKIVSGGTTGATST